MLDIVIIIVFFLMGLSIGVTIVYLFNLSRKYNMHVSAIEEFEDFCDKTIAELIVRRSKIDERHVSGVVERLVHGDYQDAAGVIHWEEGDELPEDIVRRLRDA